MVINKINKTYMFGKIGSFFSSAYNTTKSYVSSFFEPSKSTEQKHDGEIVNKLSYEKSQETLNLHEIALRAKLTDTAYKLYLKGDRFDQCNTEAHHFADSNSLSFKDFDILDISSNSEETSKHKLRSVAYVDHKSKKVILAIAGTKDKVDLIDDIQLALGLTLNKKSPMDKFLENVVAKLGDSASSYSFETTGHSLGAALSDYSAAKLLELGMKVERSTTFENPGSRTLIRNNFEIDDVRDQIVFDVYNGNPNLITSSCDYTLSDQTNLVSNNTPKKVGAFKYFLYKHFPTAARIIDGHSLKNFLEIYDEQKFKIDEVIGFASSRDGFSSPKSLLSDIRFTETPPITDAYHESEGSDEMIDNPEDFGSFTLVDYKLIHIRDNIIVDCVSESLYPDGNKALVGALDNTFNGA